MLLKPKGDMRAQLCKGIFALYIFHLPFVLEQRKYAVFCGVLVDRWLSSELGFIFLLWLAFVHVNFVDAGWKEAWKPLLLVKTMYS